MIGRLTGVVLDHGLDGCCLIDVGGVGYEVFVPMRSLSRMPLSSTATLFVHTHVREDAFLLYGFLAPEDRSTFRVLLGVSGVGPKLALTVLSDLSTPELAVAIARGERTRLEKISGVGKKTAARLLLELKDKLMLAPGVLAGSELPAASVPLGDTASQVCDALTKLGFTRAQAEGALAKLPKADHALPLEQVLRRALALLG